MTAQQEQSSEDRRRSILVVEDNDINREILIAGLEDRFDVLQADDGERGIQLFREHADTLSLVLLDVYMPKLDGFEFLRLRMEDEHLSGIPVIVTSASDSIDDEIKCLQLGCNDFIVKPYDPTVMRNRIFNTVHLRESSALANFLTWDDITHLYRADSFYRHADDVLEAYPEIEYDLVCTDIKGFKTMNERYGREACDQVLRNLAYALSSLIPSVVAAGRTGGDSFSFLIEHQEIDWLDRMDEEVRNLNKMMLFLKVGIIQKVDHALATMLLCDRAALAMEGIKGSTGIGVAYYDDELRQHQVMEQIIVESMEAALERHEFDVHYQPKHRARTGELEGAEALVRWNHPELGLIRPDLFIGVFERNGLISALDEYVCEEVCREIRHCIDTGIPIVPISYNVSRMDITDSQSLVKTVLSMVEKYNIDHSMLHIELTETAYTENPEAVTSALAKLRKNHFQIELDDFGSGYSALSALNQIPLDVLKLDGSMIRQASKSRDFRIIHAAVMIAKLLDLKTVVEGVETEEELDRLKEMGCELVQGFYFARPLKREEFEHYLVEFLGDED